MSESRPKNNRSNVSWGAGELIFLGFQLSLNLDPRMRRTVYRYNTETCRYEPVKTTARHFIGYAAGVLITAIGMLAGLLILHDFIFDSPREVQLRKENGALQKNSVVLTSQLEDIESTLGKLHDDDKRLHERFFGVPQKTNESNKKVSNHDLLIADAHAFRETIEELRSYSTDLLANAGNLNRQLSLDVNTQQLEVLNAIPTSIPVSPWSAEKLISGFGMRINPFHKGLYEHPGVDISMPRGTEVMSTADGRVKVVSRNDVQAGYGNYIEIDHGHGFVTRYAHLDQIKVRNGQKVTRGFVLGTIGSSGGSIAPHLHYEVLYQGKNVNPVKYLIRGLTSDEYYAMKQLSEKQNQSLD